jgi:hypothetical protein
MSESKMLARMIARPRMGYVEVFGFGLAARSWADGCILLGIGFIVVSVILSQIMLAWAESGNTNQGERNHG